MNGLGPLSVEKRTFHSEVIKLAHRMYTGEPRLPSTRRAPAWT